MGFMFLNGRKKLKEEEYYVAHENWMKLKFPCAEMKLYGQLGARVHLRLIQGCISTWTEGEQLQRPDGPERPLRPGVYHGALYRKAYLPPQAF